MKLINLDELVLLGPGSEWLWTAISGIVLAITFIAIYGQLRLQRSAAAIEQASMLRKEWQVYELVKAKVAILSAIRDGRDLATTQMRSFQAVANYWERIGYLVRAGHIDSKLMNETFSDVDIWWMWLAPTTRNLRREMNDDTLGEHFEWLAALSQKLDAKRGATAVDAEALARYLSIALRSGMEALQEAERPAASRRGRRRRRVSSQSETQALSRGDRHANSKRRASCPPSCAIATKSRMAHRPSPAHCGTPAGGRRLDAIEALRAASLQWSDSGAWD